MECFTLSGTYEKHVIPAGIAGIQAARMQIWHKPIRIPCLPWLLDSARPLSRLRRCRNDVLLCLDEPLTFHQQRSNTLVLQFDSTRARRLTRTSARWLNSSSAATGIILPPFVTSRYYERIGMRPGVGDCRPLICNSCVACNVCRRWISHWLKSARSCRRAQGPTSRGQWYCRTAHLAGCKRTTVVTLEYLCDELMVLTNLCSNVADGCPILERMATTTVRRTQQCD